LKFETKFNQSQMLYYTHNVQIVNTANAPKEYVCSFLC